MKFEDNYERVSPEDPVNGKIFLDKIFQRHKIDLSAPERQISLQWKNIASGQLAEISHCSGVRNGVLFVVCSNQSEASLVRMSKNEILKNAKAAFPELNITNINIRVQS